MRKIVLLALLLPSLNLRAQFAVDESGHFLLKNNEPFLWLGDTAWELFHRLNKEEAIEYLAKRKQQGFTVIQAVVLAEMDGLHEPNAYGDTPFIQHDPTRPVEKYFEHVDDVIDEADKLGLNIALLPTWGDKVFKHSWGKGPEIFNAQNAGIYANWLAKRYRQRKNIIWILGGDRNPRNEEDLAIWRAMGNAIMQATNRTAVISYHCQPNWLGSAEWFRNEEWYSFNMFQTGHCRNEPVYEKISQAYYTTPVLPVIDGEPIYEDHPVCFNAADLGTSSAYDVRKSAYLDIFSGAFGHTYGCHDIWQFYTAKHAPVNGPHHYWREALDLPGARQMIHLKNLLLQHALERVPDQSIIVENNYPPAERIQAARGSNYIMVYTAAGKPFTVLPGKVSGTILKAYWYDPRNGKQQSLTDIDNLQANYFTPPTSGYGKDWVLVLESTQ